MTEDELAMQFEKYRRSVVKHMAWRYSHLDEDIIDMLYTDGWLTLKASSFRLDHLRSYLEKTLSNRIKNYLRDRASSQDLMDRGLWMEPCERLDDRGDMLYDEEGDRNYVGNLPDLRPQESTHLEDLCDRVQLALSRVPPTLAIVGQWYYVDYLSAQAIGTRLSCTQQNVSLMLARFRASFSRHYHYLLSKEL